MARRLHDIIPGGYIALDSGLHSSQSKRKSEGFEIQENPSRILFRDTGAFDLLLHSAQSSQSCRRLAMLLSFIFGQLLTFTSLHYLRLF